MAEPESLLRLALRALGVPVVEHGSEDAPKVRPGDKGLAFPAFRITTTHELFRLRGLHGDLCRQGDCVLRLGGREPGRGRLDCRLQLFGTAFVLVRVVARWWLTLQAARAFATSRASLWDAFMVVGSPYSGTGVN